jgi:hypothetical protein
MIIFSSALPQARHSPVREEYVGAVPVLQIERTDPLQVQRRGDILDPTGVLPGRILQVGPFVSLRLMKVLICFQAHSPITLSTTLDLQPTGFLLPPPTPRHRQAEENLTMAH